MTETESEHTIAPDGYAPWSGHVPDHGRRTPVTTYRLQMGAALTFDDARRLVPYLHDLGITDVYLSPVLAAAPVDARLRRRRPHPHQRGHGRASRAGAPGR